MAAEIAALKQVHSDQVLIATEPGDIGEGDALISNRAGVALSIRTADCLPILMADPRNRAVAAVHAGWRGTVSEIAPKVIQAMNRQFGSSPEDLVVAIGPGIGGCCFEVGPEVAAQFAPLFPERDDLSGRTRIDLVESTIRQLGRCGVKLGHIATSGMCTYCLAELFHSYRREPGTVERMVTAIRLG